VVSAGDASVPGPAPRRGRGDGDDVGVGVGSGDTSSLERPSESMPITLAGSARRRVVARDTGAGAGAASASAHGSIVRWRAVGRDTGPGAGSAHGSTVVAGRRGCAAPADGVLGAAGRGDVACGVDSAVRGAADGADRVGALDWTASLSGAGTAGGGAFARAARAAGLFGSKGGGSVGFLTWSEDGVESAGATAFAGGEIGAPLCA